MFRTVAITVALLGVFGMAVVENEKSAAVAAELTRGVDMVQGVVMNAGNSRLMITPDAGDMTEFVVAPNARIMRDGEVTQLDALQMKDHVVVMCTGEGQDRVAVDIVARSPR
jgi:hypothetical protein